MKFPPPVQAKWYVLEKIACFIWTFVNPLKLLLGFSWSICLSALFSTILKQYWRMLQNNYLTLKPVLGGCRIIMAVVGDKHPQRIRKAKPDNSSLSCVDIMGTLCPLSVKHLFFQICSGHRHLSSCDDNLQSCVFVFSDWIIWQVSMGESRGNVSFPQWIGMVLSQKLASDLVLETVWTNCQGWWTVFVPWLSETFWAGEYIIPAQPVELLVLKGISWSANPLEISLCLRQKLLPWPCAKERAQS